MDRVVSNAMVDEARRRRVLINIAFAAFFGAKDAASCQALGHRPRNPIVVAQLTLGTRLNVLESAIRLRRKRAKSRVNYSAKHCANRNQCNITAQQGDQGKSNDRYGDGWPVNKRWRNQI